jgi:hypothetical protein
VVGGDTVVARAVTVKRRGLLFCGLFCERFSKHKGRLVEESSVPAETGPGQRADARIVAVWPEVIHKISRAKTV